MGASIYSKIIIIGYGVVTANVLKTVYANRKDYGYEIIYIEHECHLFNMAKKHAISQGIKNYVIEDKGELLQFFLGMNEDEATLIISASNNYIFPHELVNKKGITIINFHNALLPQYPGRNAPSWAIYNREEKTGITWHFVSDRIDAGSIIIQREISIDDNIRAYQLAAQLMEVASQSFEESFRSLIEGKIDKKKQAECGKRKIYRSYEIPGNGYFNIDEEPEKIYRLLRAIDYGKNDVFPQAKSILNHQMIRIKKYRIMDSVPDKAMGNKYFIPYNEKYLMLSYEYCSQEETEE